MAKRRDLTRMTNDEVWDFIEQQKNLQVATINKDGSVHLSTLWFAIIGESNEDKAIAFETYTKSQKILNLNRDPRITVLLEDGKIYDELRGVMIKTTAQLLLKDEEVEPIAMEVIGRNNPELEDSTLKVVAANLASKRTAVLIKPEKIISWDHTKLDGTY